MILGYTLTTFPKSLIQTKKQQKEPSTELRAIKEEGPCTRTMLKIRCTNIREKRHTYSQSTELEKAKFQTPATSNEARNCVKHNSVENISQDLVHPTKVNTDASDFESEEREEIAEIADLSAPAPALALERVEEQSHTSGSRKSTRKNLGRPASSYSDFYM